ncbi:hypothetical protein [Aquimarina spinulae]|uniref:hypothetical protein n=1 Tax=Aquimarina spinulae TaxID=1192023 RepID=UPI000D55CE6A|nr:hypothetical protein [Aquimarina spinulae]
MKYKTLHCARYFFTILGYLFFLNLILSCESDLDPITLTEAELHVSVSGTLSGNPRSSISVAIYHTKNDAIEEINTIKSAHTDDDGIAIFDHLEIGKRYWIRIDSILLKNIKLSEELNAGFNEFIIRIL